VFFNRSVHAMDAKKRLFVPKRWLQELTRDDDGNLVAILTRGQDGCLFLFSEPGFRQTIADLDMRGFTGPEQRRAQRALFANADRVTLDAAGRLLVPESLRQFAGLEKEVVLAGAGERAEIWSPERWEAVQSAEGFDYDDIDRILRDGSRNGGDGRP
jgi:transcriptional regulator MraZ